MNTLYAADKEVVESSRHRSSPFLLIDSRAEVPLVGDTNNLNPATTTIKKTTMSLETIYVTRHGVRFPPT
jgi:hypothetical protein